MLVCPIGERGVIDVVYICFKGKRICSSTQLIDKIQFFFMISNQITWLKINTRSSGVSGVKTFFTSSEANLYKTTNIRYKSIVERSIVRFLVHLLSFSFLIVLSSYITPLRSSLPQTQINKCFTLCGCVHIISLSQNH